MAVDQSLNVSLKTRFRIGEFVYVRAQRRAYDAVSDGTNGNPIVCQITAMRIDVFDHGYDVHCFVLPAHPDGTEEHIMVPEIALELAPTEE